MQRSKRSVLVLGRASCRALKARHVVLSGPRLALPQVGRGIRQQNSATPFVAGHSGRVALWYIGWWVAELGAQCLAWRWVHRDVGALSSRRYNALETGPDSFVNIDRRPTLNIFFHILLQVWASDVAARGPGSVDMASLRTTTSHYHAQSLSVIKYGILRYRIGKLGPWRVRAASVPVARPAQGQGHGPAAPVTRSSARSDPAHTSVRHYALLSTSVV
jgi:hypothetical protein